MHGHQTGPQHRCYQLKIVLHIEDILLKYVSMVKRKRQSHEAETEMYQQI